MQQVELRPIQIEAKRRTYKAWREGNKRVIFAAGTGSGKTVCASKMVADANAKGFKTTFLVDRIALIEQTLRTYQQGFGMEADTLQAENTKITGSPNLIASIQTIGRRKEFLGKSGFKPTLIIVDECHDQHGAALEYLDENPDAYVLGLTATPFTSHLAKRWDAIIPFETVNNQFELGTLVRPEFFADDAFKIDGVRAGSTGEWKGKDITQKGKIATPDVVKGIVKLWAEHFGGPVKSIGFSATIAHGADMMEALNHVEGVKVAQIYSGQNAKEREAIIAEFRKPDSELTALISCEALGKGFDVPDVLFGWECHPFRKSISSVIQHIGRVMRPAPGKEKCVWADFCGNLDRFAPDLIDVWANGPGDLFKATRLEKKARKAEKPKQCPACGKITFIRNVCMNCGFFIPPKPKDDEEISSEGVNPFAMPDPKNAWQMAEVWYAALCYAEENPSQYNFPYNRACGLYRSIYGKWPGNNIKRKWRTPVADKEPEPEAYQLIKSAAQTYKKKKRQEQEALLAGDHAARPDPAPVDGEVLENVEF